MRRDGEPGPAIVIAIAFGLGILFALMLAGLYVLALIVPRVVLG